jgi:hypothetical protein
MFIAYCCRHLALGHPQLGENPTKTPHFVFLTIGGVTIFRREYEEETNDMVVPPYVDIRIAAHRAVAQWFQNYDPTLLRGFLGGSQKPQPKTCFNIELKNCSNIDQDVLTKLAAYLQ